jgi:hypothetical protein
MHAASDPDIWSHREQTDKKHFAHRRLFASPRRHGPGLWARLSRENGQKMAKPKKQINSHPHTHRARRRLVCVSVNGRKWQFAISEA